MKFAGREYLNHPMELNIWRAPTDNDMYIKSEWKKAHYDRAYTRAYTTEVVQGRHGVKIISHASVVAETVQKILDVMIAWKIDNTGRIDADIAVTKDDEFPDLPRFGVRMFLDKKHFRCQILWNGTTESYLASVSFLSRNIHSKFSAHPGTASYFVTANICIHSSPVLSIFHAIITSRIFCTVFCHNRSMAYNLHPCLPLHRPLWYRLLYKPCGKCAFFHLRTWMYISLYILELSKCLTPSDGSGIPTLDISSL